MTWAVLFGAASFLSGGCGNDAFAPPPPPELSVVTSARAMPKTVVELILPGGESNDRDVWKMAAQNEAGDARVILSVNPVPPGDPPATEAKLIRAAGERKVSALIIEPSDRPETAEALNDVRDNGIPVVVLSKKVAARDPARPFHRVSYASYDKPIKDLVAGVMNEARVSGLPADGHAVVVHNTTVGSICDETAKLFPKALSEAGVNKVTVIDFDGENEKAATALLKALDADPKITMLLSADPVGLSASNSTVLRVKETRGLSIGGCQTVDKLYGGPGMSSCAGVVDRNTPGLGREAFLTALKLVRGESVPEDKVIPILYVPNTSAGAAGAAGAKPKVIKMQGLPRASVPD